MADMKPLHFSLPDLYSKEFNPQESSTMLLDQIRLEVSATLDPRRRAEYGQYMTPSRVAAFMASLFPAASTNILRLLDAGAGVGSLTSAVLERWRSGDLSFVSGSVTTYEIDDAVRPYLTRTLEAYADQLPLDADIVGQDFIEQAVRYIEQGEGPHYTHAILNPPYAKIGSDSRHRLLLRRVGIETVNLYTAFVALTVALMEPRGQVVAIIPRSFCNGPYYRPFREFLFQHAAIRHLHLFGSRKDAFKDDAVLQENIIVLLERDGVQGRVTISTSTDDTFADYAVEEYPAERIVYPGDPEQFIHVPTPSAPTLGDLPAAFSYSLSDLGLTVSTGPVVDFRLKEHLRAMPGRGTVPLLYPAHFAGQTLEWPKEGQKKPNALALNEDTRRWLYPSGWYAVTRRFSSKEEKRRIVAGVVSPDALGSKLVGFENHLNVFHAGRDGLPEALARGLAVYLNSTVVDEHFRRFSGHTQVNATDLRRMMYPSRETLLGFGTWLAKKGGATQNEIDRKVEKSV